MATSSAQTEPETSSRIIAPSRTCTLENSDISGQYYWTVAPAAPASGATGIRSALLRVGRWGGSPIRRGDPVRRFLVKLVVALARRLRGRSPAAPQDRLTAVEYEAVTLITYEGQEAYARACQQAAYCRRRGSKEGSAFWSQVADEVLLRTKGRIPERRQ
jgi:hypothetical protein